MASGEVYIRLHEEILHCPWCGERLTLLVDESVADQNYVEDCQVCCRPMLVNVTVSWDGDIDVTAERENE